MDFTLNIVHRKDCELTLFFIKNVLLCNKILVIEKMCLALIFLVFFVHVVNVWIELVRKDDIESSIIFIELS